MTMTPTIYVGLVVSSHVAGNLATATFNATSVATGGSTTAPPPPPPPPASTSSSTFRFVQWNTQHGGIGTDGVYDPNRLVAALAKMNPDAASLNEVDTQDQVNAIMSALRAITGVTWYYSWSGKGNFVVSRLPIQSQSLCQYDPAYPNIFSAHASLLVNGRPLNIWSAHLHVSSASNRLTETKGLQTCAQTWAEARIISGDFNMQYQSPEYYSAVTGYNDAWLTAKALGTATTYAGNCDGCTRNSRIDYVFTSKGATNLVVKSAHVVDTRDANGVRPADHKPLLVVFEVR